jgi:hypothetical protein
MRPLSTGLPRQGIQPPIPCCQDCHRSQAALPLSPKALVANLRLAANRCDPAGRVLPWMAGGPDELTHV